MEKRIEVDREGREKVVREEWDVGGKRRQKGWFKMERAANRSLRLFVRELLRSDSVMLSEHYDRSH